MHQLGLYNKNQYPDPDLRPNSNLLYTDKEQELQNSRL